jgi:hypothetical protein
MAISGIIEEEPSVGKRRGKRRPGSLKARGVEWLKYALSLCLSSSLLFVTNDECWCSSVCLVWATEKEIGNYAGMGLCNRCEGKLGMMAQIREGSPSQVLCE